MADTEHSAEQAHDRYLPRWAHGTLPPPPSPANWRGLIGPGLLMVGASIGGGEWIFGSIVTARYGGVVMWIAAVSIAFQAVFNLAVMRYALYTGEPILVGFLRTWPGPRFWAVTYLIADLGYIWPFLAANAAVPLAGAWLGRMPGPADDAEVRALGYAIFLAAFVPLVFGGKIYNAVERVMSVKVFLVLGYLLALDAAFVRPAAWAEVFGGFLRVGVFPAGEVEWGSLAAFAAAAGAGGLSNTLFSNYVRDKGWGMGAAVGAIPSLVGGRTIRLSHVGKVPALSREELVRWQSWLRHIRRDQILWAGGCVLGVALPALLSLEFLRGAEVGGHGAAALIAEGVASRHGRVYWHLTLLCGFLVLGPGVVQTIDGVCRRWTDVAWTAVGRFRRADPGRAHLTYYAIMAAYCGWGLIALGLTPDPLVLAIVGSSLGNVGFAIAALHVIHVNRRLLPKPARPSRLSSLGLVGASVFFAAITAIAFAQQWRSLDPEP